MAESLLSVPGRCPRCEQVLNVSAGHLEGVFRCARCQYRALGSALVEAARQSPPRGASAAPGALSQFDEDSDDQHTQIFDPDANDPSELPLDAIFVDEGGLSRFEADSDDQHTRLHLSEPPAPARAAPSLPPPRPPASSRLEATLMGMPSAGGGLQVFGGEPDDPDDEATRMHWVDDAQRPSSGPPPSGGEDQTLVGVAPAANSPAAFGSYAPPRPGPESAAPPRQAVGAGLSRFDDESEDSEDQHTRLHVPISYEDDEPVPDLRAPVAPQPAAMPGVAAPAFDADLSGLRASAATQFGMDTLQLSRFIDDWLHGQRTVLIVTLAMLCAAIAPLLDRVSESERQAATVITSNLVLFFLWTLAFAWLGKLRNDRFVWDYRIAWTRLITHAKLIAADLGSFGSLPTPLRFRALGELFGAVGLSGLWVSCTLTVSQLVWNVPESVPGLFFARFSCSVLIVMAAICRSRTATTSAGLYDNWEISAPVMSKFPAIVDLSLPLSVDPALRATPLYELLEVMSQWQPRSFPNRDAYQSALQRHLLKHMAWASVERDHWLGEQRTDGIAHVMVNDTLLVEVCRGFDGAAADRISARLKRLARTWRGRPALVVIFDASRAAVTQSDATPPLESLHQAYPMLTVRMPSADPAYY